jgi:ABC-type dipeptide/oligopeptide/nickel transport system permease component
MIRLVLGRTAAAALVLVVVFTTTFALFRLAPGGPFQTGGRARPPEVSAMLNEKYGLDDPAWAQYGRYAKAAIQGDFGPSFGQPGTSVGSIVAETLPVSLQLSAAAMLVACLIGIPCGVVAARHRGSARDRAISVVTATSMAVPDFVAVSLLVIVLGVYVKVLPPQGWDGLASTAAVIPVVALALGPAAVLARYTRAFMLETGSADFVVAARARGLSRRAVDRAILRNSIVPVLGIGGIILAALVGGSFFVETVYNIPGIGRESVKGIVARDYPLIMGTVLVFAVIVVAVNLAVDVVTLMIDPRLARRRD